MKTDVMRALLVEITLQVEADGPMRNTACISQGPISFCLKCYFH